MKETLPSTLTRLLPVGLLTGALLWWTAAPAPPPTGEAPASPAVAAASSDFSLPRARPPAPIPEAAPLTWLMDQVMVAPAPRVTLEALSERHGARVVRAVGHSGYGVLELPTSDNAQIALDALRSDEHILAIARHGLTTAAGSAGSAGLSWHHEALSLPQMSPTPGAAIVAVADTGLTLSGADAPFARTGGLAGVSLVAPWDFVNDDDFPDDDHGHGTHLASLIASEGSLPGVSPGASLMPLKILDERGVGTEYDLIEAIWWAVDNGADVLTLGLTLGPDYVPSDPLLEALDAARQARVLMTAAAGNASEQAPRWPAASGAVLAVGAVCLEHGEYTLAPYSNRGVGLSLLAPGGCMERDEDRDGLPDGVAAETLDPADHGRTGPWMFSGTSQAAALIAGSAARLLSEGTRPEDVPVALQHTARRLEAGGFKAGLGAGIPNLTEAIALAESFPLEGYAPLDVFHVSVMPFLRVDAPGTVTPAARLVTLDADLSPAQEVEVHGTIEGATRASFSCRPAADGACVISGEAWPADQAGAWAFQVEVVVLGETVGFPPGGLVFASEALEVLTSETQYQRQLANALPVVSWEQGPHTTLGELAGAYAAPNLRVGAATPPTALLMTRGLIDGQRKLSSEDVTLALGDAEATVSLKRIRGDALGDRHDPFTHAPIDLLVMDAANAALPALHLFGPRQRACADCTFNGEPVLLSAGLIASEGDTSQSAIQFELEHGGWTSNRLGGATALIAGGPTRRAQIAVADRP